MLRSVTVYAYLTFAVVWLTVSGCLAADRFDNPAAIIGTTAVLYLVGGVIVSAAMLGIGLMLMRDEGAPGVVVDFPTEGPDPAPHQAA